MVARPAGATEGPAAFGVLGAGRGGGATLSFGERWFPLYSERGVRFGEAETPRCSVDRNSSTSDLGAQRKNAWRLAGTGGFAPAWRPRPY